MSAIEQLMSQAERIFYGEAEANIYAGAHVFRVKTAALSRDKATVHCTVKGSDAEIEIRASAIVAIEEIVYS
ncbi:MAG: hypothetical protein NTX28_10280 [Novosphingobium sp.]|nr:hypothetical protein [Novosphingobium sp.]